MNVEATVARTRHTITVGDGTEIFFKDWGTGQPIVFSHGSPLNSDAWEDQMVFLPDRGYRCVAHDRRGHGRSSPPWTGHDVCTYAADIPAIVAYIEAFSESDHRDDLKAIDVPTLILHGDDDQIVPITASAMVSATLVKGSTLKVYPGLSNGMCTVNKDQINTDLLAFIRSA